MKKENIYKWAILTTGWGRNAFDLIKTFNDNSQALGNSTISVLIYETDPCGAADVAKRYGIKTIQLKRADFNDQIDYQKYICEKLIELDIDFIFLLNYKYIIKETLLNKFENRILNIHPSLLPSFKGTKTAIQDAIAYGVKITGLTTHVVNEEVDGGAIIAQKTIKIKPKDTFESLYPKFSKKGKKLIIKSINLVTN
ncbi:formyltransferase family protein [Aquimarina sp. W85]|uniref:formyltransferase family protein n=1 Tax=Aquimarina rhodophyticola TaxID=3342246 RepID=UPI003670D52F